MNYHVGGQIYTSSPEARREAERLCRQEGAGHEIRITDDAGEWAGEARSFIRGDGLLGSSSCIGWGRMAPVDEESARISEGVRTAMEARTADTDEYR